MMHGKYEQCKTCVNKADLISPMEEAICPDCVDSSEYVETLIDRLKREKSELENKLKIAIEANNKLMNKAKHLFQYYPYKDEIMTLEEYFKTDIKSIGGS